MIKLSESPVDQTQLAICVVDHNVVWFHVAVHDSFRVTEIKRLQHFEDVVADIEISECFIKRAEIHVSCINKLHNQRRGFRHWITNDVKKIDDVDPVSKCLQYFDLAPNLSFLDGLEDLDDDSLVVQRVDTFVDLRVLASSNLLDDLIVVL